MHMLGWLLALLLTIKRTRSFQISTNSQLLWPLSDVNGSLRSNGSSPNCSKADFCTLLISSTLVAFLLLPVFLGCLRVNVVVYFYNKCFACIHRS